MKEAINTTIRGTFTVKACNAGTLDGSGYDHITIVRPCTDPACGKVLDTFLASATYTLHAETAGGAADFGFQSVEKAKAVADLLWNASTTDYITITNDDTAEVLYRYEAASKLPF